MRKLSIGLAAAPLLTGIAMARQPRALTDAQMYTVTAGQLIEVEWAGIIELNFFPNNVEAGPDSPPGPPSPSSILATLRTRLVGWFAAHQGRVRGGLLPHM
jgi:hypothetical protein